MIYFLTQNFEALKPRSSPPRTILFKAVIPSETIFSWSLNQGPGIQKNKPNTVPDFKESTVVALLSLGNKSEGARHVRSTMTSIW